MNRKDKADVWRNRIRWLTSKRDNFFMGTGRYADPDGDSIGGQPGADFAIAAYRGEMRAHWWNNQDVEVRVNKTKAAIRAALPSLLYANPEYNIYPAARDIEAGQDVAYERSRAKKLWLNHIYSEASGNTHVRIAIQNAFCSYGVIKAGYRCHYQDDGARGVFAKNEAGEYLLDENGDPTLSQGKFLKDEGGLIRDDDGIPLLHPGKLTKEQWDISAVDPRMMLFDIESGPDFFQHRFVIEEWLRPLEEVKADPRFKKAARDRLTASATMQGAETQRKSVFGGQSSGSTHGGNGSSEAVDADEARIRGWDIYDFVEDRYYVLPESGDGDDEFLLDDVMPTGMEQGPYRFLKFTEDMGTEWYPIPDGIDMALTNLEYNITRSQMMIHREHTKTRYLEMPGAFDGAGIDAEEERAKWATGADASLIKVSSANAILPAPKGQLDNSFMQAIPNIAADFNEVSGMPGESRGIADSDTATQASILAGGAQMRNEDRRDNQVQLFLAQIGRMLLMSGQANAELDTLVVEKVREATGVAPFKARRLTREELLGEFEVTIAVGSTQAKNSPQAMQNLMQFLGMVSQNPIIGQSTGLMRRALDGMGLDPQLADELKEMAEAWKQSQQKGSPEGATPPGQQLQEMLTGGTVNAAGGAATGAPIN